VNPGSEKELRHPREEHHVEREHMVPKVGQLLSFLMGNIFLKRTEASGFGLYIAPHRVAKRVQESFTSGIQRRAVR
jgi:hypothetical protein